MNVKMDLKPRIRTGNFRFMDLNRKMKDQRILLPNVGTLTVGGNNGTFF